jgi:hypothetical protein
LGIQLAVNLKFPLAQFTKVSKAQASALRFLPKDITAVQRLPSKAFFEALNEGARSASGMARDRDLDHAHTHS